LIINYAQNPSSPVGYEQKTSQGKGTCLVSTACIRGSGFIESLSDVFVKFSDKKIHQAMRISSAAERKLQKYLLRNNGLRLWGYSIDGLFL